MSSVSIQYALPYIPGKWYLPVDSQELGESSILPVSSLQLCLPPQTGSNQSHLRRYIFSKFQAPETEIRVYHESCADRVQDKRFLSWFQVCNLARFWRGTNRGFGHGRGMGIGCLVFFYMYRENDLVSDAKRDDK
jgi:hypothetical protein